MGENGGRTTGQVLSHGTYTCLAWCFMFLAHIHRVGSAGLAPLRKTVMAVAEKCCFCRAKRLEDTTESPTGAVAVRCEVP